MRKHLKITATLVAATLVTALVASADPPPYTGKKVENGAKLKGKATYAGDMAKANEVDKTEKDPESCGKERTKDDLRVAADKSLANVVVYIKKIDSGKDWTDAQKKVVLDQKSCAYREHVVLVAEGGEVVFKNSDGVLHNIKATASQNEPFNEGVGPGKEMTKKFEKAEFVKLGCSVHPWMSGVIVVMKNPYYVVTNEKGEYEMTDIPAGKYTIFAEHETLGKAEAKGTEIDFKAGETQTKNYELK
ncbi:hypothetical protein HY251_19295 [bacterium]|nr:hypothetical protein [bacterium]